MNAASFVPCAACGKPIDPHRAARVRFSAQKQWFFCSEEHADGFTLPGVRSMAAAERTAHEPTAPLAAWGRPDPTPAAASTMELVTESNPQPERAPHPAGGKNRYGNMDFSSSRGTEAASPDTGFAPLAVAPPSVVLPAVTGSERPRAAWASADLGPWSNPPGTTSSFAPLDATPHIEPASAAKAPVTLAPATPAPPDVPMTTRMSAADGRAERQAQRARLAFYLPLGLLSLTTLTSIVQGTEYFAQLISWGLFISVFAVDAVRRPTDLGAASMWTRTPALSSRVRVEQSGALVEKELSGLRAGEEVAVLAGEDVAVDGVVSSGEATVLPWPGASKTTSVRGGTRVVAGAHVVEGQLRVVATKAAERRAFAEPSALLGQHRLLSLSRWVSWVIGPILGLVTALVFRFESESWLSALSAAACISATFALPMGVRLGRALVFKAWETASKRGISFASAAAFDRAGQVNAVIFCARGTVLHGEPDVAEVHVFRGATEAQVLSLAAGAESAVHHPVASSTIRAAHNRGIEVDACRGHHVTAGLGVVCSSSDGRLLVVGNRELLLREKVSVAIAEETLRVLEARGNTTLLVALDGRLLGVLGLQDNLVAGARAAFQLLLDHKLEPILLSGDTRATTEAVAQALSCEHVRPEVPALARAREVKSLMESGFTVAVVGNTPRDDAALGAAHVPVVLDGAALVRADSPHEHERGIGLANDRVVDAAAALLIAHHAHQSVQFFMISWTLFTALGAFVVMLHLVPLFVAPAMALLGISLGHVSAKKASEMPLPE